MSGDRAVEGTILRGEASYERSLRPANFSEYVGQAGIVDNLKVFVTAAVQRGDALDHVLLYGPPGLGKTSLAHVIAAELGTEIVVTSGPSLEKKGDLAGILTSLPPRAVLFIDEIHRLSPAVEENLYSAMEDYRFDVVIGEGPGARTVPITLEPFTLIGATTRSGLLTGPLRDRFGYPARLEYYGIDDLIHIIERSAGIIGVPIDGEATAELASRARGTPRIANRLVRRVRDFAEVEGEGRLDLGMTQHALARLGIDEIGLDALDNEYLRRLIETFEGGPVGIDTLAAAIGEESGTLEDVCEPYLIQIGFLKRSPRGRLATAMAKRHWGAFGAEGQTSLPNI